MGKPADQEVGFTYPQGGGDDINIYKQPQNYTVEDVVHEKGESLSGLNIAVASQGKNDFKPENPFGQKEMRGFGAATKGRKTSGKLG